MCSFAGGTGDGLVLGLMLLCVLKMEKRKLASLLIDTLNCQFHFLIYVSLSTPC